MKREEVLIIAKNCYEDILEVIKEYKIKHHESYPGFDGCIEVDEYLFHERELKNEE
jgi:hypothetical protein